MPIVLGVKWDGVSARTEDVDIGVGRVLEVAVAAAEADVPRAIEKWASSRAAEGAIEASFCAARP
jgi:hypothetical protein